jgi:hypothetical protein
MNPLVLGAGIPLLTGAVRQTALGLAGNKIYNSSFILLYYRVKH